MAPVADVKELTRLGLELIRNDDTLNIFKQNAKEQAMKFDIHHIVPIYEELYERFVPVSAAAKP